MSTNGRCRPSARAFLLRPAPAYSAVNHFGGGSEGSRNSRAYRATLAVREPRLDSVLTPSPIDREGRRPVWQNGTHRSHM